MTKTAERHEFQAEVKQLLDIVIHSLYSHKDIFLRELISNASDALDKLRFAGLTNSELLPSGDLHIELERNPDVRTLSVSDNGIGMSRAELTENIGTIAKSGTADFIEAIKDAKDQRLAPELIGQFGVGFYASFMVADRVSVLTRRAGEETATRWESAGDGYYNVAEAERPVAGTTVTLHLKPVDDENGIQDYTDELVVKDIVRRYSDFVAYPILMETRQPAPERDAEGKPKPDAASGIEQTETLNSMKAIWTRPKSDVTEDEYKEFYKHITHDWSDPLTHIAATLEGGVQAKALLYIPSIAPPDLYYREMSYRGLQLYVKRIFILDECRDLMPQHLRFIKGVVDAEDLSLNVSRELLQQDRQIAAIRRFLERKVMDTLRKLKSDDFDSYRGFWTQFGAVIKEGLLSWDEKRDQLLDLVLCHSTRDDQLTTLADYVGRMKRDEDPIYYLTAPSLETARHSPHVEGFLDRGYEVAFLTDPVDEVWLQHAPEYQGHRWQSIGRGDVDLGDDTGGKEGDESGTDPKTFESLLAALHKHLEDEVKEIRLSNRLTSSPACLVGEAHDLSPQIAEMLRRAGQEVPKVKRILELNPSHPILAKLQTRYGSHPNDPALADYAALLYGQAVLAEGGELDDPAAFSRRVADVMARGL